MLMTVATVLCQFDNQNKPVIFVSLLTYYFAVSWSVKAEQTKTHTEVSSKHF